MYWREEKIKSIRERRNTWRKWVDQGCTEPVAHFDRRAAPVQENQRGKKIVARDGRGSDSDGSCNGY